MSIPKIYVGSGYPSKYNTISVTFNEDVVMQIPDLYTFRLWIVPRKTPDQNGATHTAYILDRDHRYPNLHWQPKGPVSKPQHELYSPPTQTQRPGTAHSSKYPEFNNPQNDDLPF